MQYCETTLLRNSYSQPARSLVCPYFLDLVCLVIVIWSKVKKSSESLQAVVRQLSGSCQAVVRQTSGSRQAVVRQSSGRRQAVIRQLSGSRQAVVRQLSAVVRQFKQKSGRFVIFEQPMGLKDYLGLFFPFLNW